MTIPPELQSTAEGDQAALEINRRHALWSSERFRLLYPQYNAELYVRDWHYELLVEGVEPTQFDALAKHFDQNVRPISCAIRLVHDQSPGTSLVIDVITYRDELWVSHEPLRMVDAQRAFVMARANLPKGELNYEPQKGQWTFTAEDAISEEAQLRVREAFAVINQPGNLHIEVQAPKLEKPFESTVAAADKTKTERVTAPALSLDIRTSVELSRYPLTLRRLAERDEEDWRVFLRRRAERSISQPSMQPSELACLFDAQDESAISLSELLTLYDRVNILPPTRGVGGRGALERFSLSEPDFQELVRLGRVRLVLPYSVEHYDARLIEAAFNAHPDAVVMSRGLAARSISSGQAKDPLLYGPFDRSQRQQVLHALSRIRREGGLGRLVDSYGKIIAGQHQLFMDRGALASLGAGFGAHIANVMGSGHAPNFGVMLAGAHVEWSLALGATYVPLTMREFSLDNEVALVGSFYGRASQVPHAPFADRMHEVANGLLAVSDVPALDVARNLSSPALQRFRNVARKMLRHAATIEEIQAAVGQLNEEVMRYESRIDTLKRWNVFELAGHTATHGVAAYLHHASGLAGSVLGLWLVEKLYEQLPHVMQDELENTADAIRGLALSPSYDAVVLRQTREALRFDGR